MEGKYRAAGLIYGPDAHHIDHLAVICTIMDIPLIVTEDEVAKLVEKYYPNLQLTFLEPLEVTRHLLQNFDILYSCLPRPLIDEIFFLSQRLLGKKIHTIWCPHGNSDKGASTFFMEGLREEEAALLYGKKMIDFLIEKQAFAQLKASVMTGNFRYQFYRAHKAFYDQALQKELGQSMKPGARTILYAPTWQDAEKSSSFFDACPTLIETLPENCNLIVKLHPNLFLQDDLKVQRLMWKYEETARLKFITDFPPIYPLLDFVDIYVGDMSSIGYDFLSFDKPMYFFNQNNRNPATDAGLYLHRCGISIPHEDYQKVYQIIEHTLPSDTLQFSKIRKETYAYTFGKEKELSKLKQEIEKSYTTFADNELDFL
jgi:hypothetical protein